MLPITSKALCFSDVGSITSISLVQIKIQELFETVSFRPTILNDISQIFYECITMKGAYPLKTNLNVKLVCAVVLVRMDRYSWFVLSQREFAV